MEWGATGRYWPLLAATGERAETGSSPEGRQFKSDPRNQFDVEIKGFRRSNRKPFFLEWPIVPQLCHFPKTCRKVTAQKKTGIAPRPKKHLVKK
jgi:hypothetical protein